MGVKFFWRTLQPIKMHGFCFTGQKEKFQRAEAVTVSTSVPLRTHFCDIKILSSRQQKGATINKPFPGNKIYI